MVSDAAIARQINDLMLDLFHRVEESVCEVKEQCPAHESEAYIKATAPVVGAIVMDVLEPLYRQHPELKPHNWDDD